MTTPTAGPAQHTIGCDPPIAQLPQIGCRVQTITDRMEPGSPPPPPRRGQVIGHAVIHHRPGDTDDERQVVTWAVVALDHADQGWLTRGPRYNDDGDQDHSCFVAVILADPDNLEHDDSPPDEWERNAGRHMWGLPIG